MCSLYSLIQINGIQTVLLGVWGSTTNRTEGGSGLEVPHSAFSLLGLDFQVQVHVKATIQKEKNKFETEINLHK